MGVSERETVQIKNKYEVTSMKGREWLNSSDKTRLQFLIDYAQCLQVLPFTSDAQNHAH